MPGMDDATAGMTGELSRRQASDAVSGLGWRYMLGVLRTRVRVESLAQAVEVSARAVAACGEAAVELAGPWLCKPVGLAAATDDALMARASSHGGRGCQLLPRRCR